MLELALLGAMVVIMAAHRKTGGSRRYNLRRVRSSPQLTLGTLAALTVLTSTIFADPVGRPYRIVSYIATWHAESFVTAADNIIVGFAHGDYSVTEIKECLEAGGSIVQGNKIDQERANRMVRIVGSFSGSGRSVLNEGLPIKTRLNWPIQIGQTLNMFAYNDGAALLTTGAFVKANGNAFVKDL